MRRCVTCCKNKPKSKFYGSGKPNKGLRGSCKSCLNKASNKWRKEHPQLQSIYDARARRKRKYGLTKEFHELLLVSQDGRCLICKKKSTELRVDHDHKTKKIRGLLCNNCNTGLGMFKDKIYLLYQAILYLYES